ncbi:MAG: helix-turn-helix domain-containing protein [Candidatus Limimorpha sp.]
MKREIEISKNNKNMLLMSNIDLDKTEWIEQYGNDIIFIHNPSFKFCNHEPYRLEQMMAVICEEGNASGAVNLKPYQLKKNSFLIVLSSHIAEAYEVSDDFKGTYIFMSEQFLSRLDIGDSYKLYESIENNPLFHFDEQTATALRLYIDMSISISRQKDKNPNTYEAIRLLTKLFFLMMGWFIHPITENNDTDARHLIIMNDFLKIVKQYYREYRDVEFYAQKLNMTAKYMSTQIKKASGKSALQWIEDYVILDAKAQLASTMNSIQQITYGLNFPTQSYFGRYFKRAVGMSPSEYRRAARKAYTDTQCESDDEIKGEPCDNR